jgi:methylmalonyl-CoA/ethylmalonyl-CoA epimerase
MSNGKAWPREKRSIPVCELSEFAGSARGEGGAMAERKIGTGERRLAAREQPKRKPSFTETMQVGIVVRDLEATMRRYVEDYGIGPWDIYEFNPDKTKDLREYGQPVERSWRLATTMIGRVYWELIEPLDDKSVYAQFLAEKGEGVHHIAVAAADFDEAVAAQAKRGKELVLSGEFSGIKVAYLPTERDLGVLIEIFNGMPDVKQEPDAT